MYLESKAKDYKRGQEISNKYSAAKTDFKLRHYLSFLRAATGINDCKKIFFKEMKLLKHN